MSPSVCPLCNGAGDLPNGVSTTAGQNTKPCHACYGRGIVWPPWSVTPLPAVTIPTWPPPQIPEPWRWEIGTDLRWTTS